MTGLRFGARPSLYEGGGAVSSNRMDDFIKWPPEKWAAMRDMIRPLVAAHAVDEAEAGLFFDMLIDEEAAS